MRMLFLQFYNGRPAGYLQLCKSESIWELKFITSVLCADTFNYNVASCRVRIGGCMILEFLKKENLH